jgi:ABC-type thiamine transport system ATPase subunit
VSSYLRLLWRARRRIRLVPVTVYSLAVLSGTLAVLVMLRDAAGRGGLSGAGKTTLVKLLCGLYQPAGGRILIDGQDLAGLDPGSWRSRVAILFQDFHRIELTLRESIGHGGIARAGDTGAVAAAAEKARANRVLRAVPGGLNGYVGHSYADGTELSGGQRHPPRAHDRPRAVRRTVHPPGPRLPSARPFPLTPSVACALAASPA